MHTLNRLHGWWRRSTDRELPPLPVRPRAWWHARTCGERSTNDVNGVITVTRAIETGTRWAAVTCCDRRADGGCAGATGHADHVLTGTRCVVCVCPRLHAHGMPVPRWQPSHAGNGSQHWRPTELAGEPNARGHAQASCAQRRGQDLLPRTTAMGAQPSNARDTAASGLACGWRDQWQSRRHAPGSLLGVHVKKASHRTTPQVSPPRTPTHLRGPHRVQPGVSSTTYAYQWQLPVIDGPPGERRCHSDVPWCVLFGSLQRVFNVVCVGGGA